MSTDVIRALAGADIDGVAQEKDEERRYGAEGDDGGHDGTVLAPLDDGVVFRRRIDQLLEQARRDGFAQGDKEAREEFLAMEEARLVSASQEARQHEVAQSAQLNAAVSRVQAHYVDTPPSHACEEQQNAVRLCYESNRPLDCADLVKAFSACSLRARQKFVKESGKDAV